MLLKCLSRSVHCHVLQNCAQHILRTTWRNFAEFTKLMYCGLWPRDDLIRCCGQRSTSRQDDADMVKIGFL